MADFRQGVTGVAEVVQAQVGHAGGLAGPSPGPIEGVEPEGSAPFLGENQVVGVRAGVAGQVGVEVGHDVGRDGDGAPAGGGLWGAR